MLLKHRLNDIKQISIIFYLISILNLLIKKQQLNFNYLELIVVLRAKMLLSDQEKFIDSNYQYSDR